MAYNFRQFRNRLRRDKQFRNLDSGILKCPKNEDHSLGNIRNIKVTHTVLWHHSLPSNPSLHTELLCMIYSNTLIKLLIKPGRVLGTYVGYTMVACHLISDIKLWWSVSIYSESLQCSINSFVIVCYSSSNCLRSNLEWKRKWKTWFVL